MKVYKEKKLRCYLESIETCKNMLRTFKKKFGPIISGKARKWWDNRIKALNEQHIGDKVCEDFADYFKNGEEEGMTSLIHIPRIRTYAILNKKKYGGWTAIDYCPFCGAKLPERMDGVLTKILQKEYYLNSHEDFKKAPHEFWTDEWWKKRHLDDPKVLAEWAKRIPNLITKPVYNPPMNP